MTQLTWLASSLRQGLIPFGQGAFALPIRSTREQVQQLLLKQAPFAGRIRLREQLPNDMILETISCDCGDPNANIQFLWFEKKPFAAQLSFSSSAKDAKLLRFSGPSPYEGSILKSYYPDELFDESTKRISALFGQQPATRENLGAGSGTAVWHFDAPNGNGIWLALHKPVDSSESKLVLMPPGEKVE